MNLRCWLRRAPARLAAPVRAKTAQLRRAYGGSLNIAVAPLPPYQAWRRAYGIRVIQQRCGAASA
jgi:hypothetical protein